MKSHSLELLFRYRNHLLETEQIQLQQKIAEEDQQKTRLENIQMRIRRTHEAKLHAKTVEGICVLDEAAAYLHGRFVMAKRALGLASLAREEATGKTLLAKQACDQIGLLLESGRRERLQNLETAERRELDDMASARHLLSWGKAA